ncbi:MAG: DUF4369 domain-containing protein [Winogradskyella sp.]|uniref:DUF4369 domain-containing protein n=1 Tax=Winogradskyella sp. TaxID=1883156 RepID=UPI0017D248A7|nr:DUF4369 domain-containing protein [Winogradskyella sp.]MBT8243699.1 DUF4369 domain-containing protein [Winogradskyella sp.]NNK23984.1 DUF4369 domain-containing protein [Winogradskyella sp.]
MRLQHLIYSLIIASILVSCGKEEKANFTLKGKIKDLKKGVVYLQKDGRSRIINLDSVVIMGKSNFTLQTDIKEPVLLYLKLDKYNDKEYFIPFFADKGITEINTSLKNFSGDAEITGSKQQAVLEQYLKLVSDFKDRNLDLIEANIEAVRKNDALVSDSLQKLSDRLLRLKYASTINFALNNNDSEVAPYLALYEVPNTSVKFLDTIYGNLTKDIKYSYYGRKLGKALENFEKAQDSLNK